MAAEIVCASERIDTFKHTHNAETTAKTPLIISLRVAIPLHDAAADAENVYVYRAPRVLVDKAANEAWAAGAKIYFDATAGKFTTTATDNTLAGLAVAGAALADTTGYIDLSA